MAVLEGPNATDQFNFQQNFNLLANPQVAVGPEDVVMLVNSQIFRVPNGNAPGVLPATLYPNYTSIGGQGNSFQRAFLDNWIGETAMNNLCPTGAPSGANADTTNSRSATTCRIENGTVRYDQMHGRFLVLFTVVDTGLVYDNFAQSYTVARPRKASWVLLVSRFSVLVDQACLQGTSTGTGVGCTSSATVPTPGGPNPAGTFAFANPAPSTGSNTGGINPDIWAIYYGNALGTGASDGFGSNLAHSGSWVGNVGVGNINSLPGITGSSASFDCRPSAIYAPGTVGTKVCYIPTAARLGIDNDTITIVSPVINANINSANVSATNNPPAQIPAYAGNRVRVIKKQNLYIWPSSLAAGNQFAGSESAKATGAYYDLFTNDGAGNPVANTGGSPIVYTAVASSTPCVSGTNYSTQNTFPSSNITACTPIFYEPAHLRGRPQATFSNNPSYTGNASKSQTYLVANAALTGTYHVEFFIQGIRQIFTATPSLGVAYSYYPVLQTGVGNGQTGEPSVNYTSTAYSNPGLVTQQNLRGGASSPQLYVGDSRPHRIIFREGHLYETQVNSTQNPQTTFPGGLVGTQTGATVAYNVFQKLTSSFPAQTILTTQWQNSQVYAPMFDTPVNVKLIGVVTPTSTLNNLEKLFAATTFPPLAGAPAGPTSLAYDTYANSNAGDPRSRETYGATGLPPTSLLASSVSPAANCYNYQYSPGVPLTGASGILTNAPLAWPSLFDIRCGQDAIDSNPSLVDPNSGAVQSRYAYTIRGDAGTDPNDGSLWLFGAYAQKRNTGLNSIAHFGTMAANYKLSAPTATDEYGNSTNLYADLDGAGVSATDKAMILYGVNVGLTSNLGSAVTPLSAPNITPLALGAGPGSATLYAGTTPLPGTAPTGANYGPNDYVTRREMAAWIVKSIMDEQAITDYLSQTGGNIETFADVPTSDKGWRYIEVMARRGYTSGCLAGVARRYCPDYISTRKDLAVFMIRAKFSNIFPSVLSGCAFTFTSGTTGTAASTIYPPAMSTTCGTSGDNFANFITGLNYFVDNPAVTGNDEYPFIQKMREMRITNGTSLGAANDGRAGRYSRGPVGFTALPSTDAADGLAGYLLRKQVATFMVRGFFL